MMRLLKELNISAEHTETALRALRGSELFALLGDAELRLLLPLMRARGYDAGETVFREGEPGDALYLVYSGGVEVRRKGLLFSKAVARIDAGRFFGEMALLFADPRSATVLCVEPTTLLLLPAQDFRDLLSRHLDIASKVQSVAVIRRELS